MNLAKEPVQPDRLRALPGIVLVELTSRCNLRCAYCATTLPAYESHDLSGLDAGLIDEIESLHPEEVHLNGHGESTVLRGWQEVARSVRRRGLAISLTTNMARPLGPDELDALSRMRQVTVSCDTSDPELFARLRSGARLEVVEQNLRGLLAYCRDHFRRPPHIAINAVVLEETLAGLVPLARWAAVVGASNLSLVNFTPYDELPAGANVGHPADIGDGRRARCAIEEVGRVARELDLTLDVMPGLALRLGLGGAP